MNKIRSFLTLLLLIPSFCYSQNDCESLFSKPKYESVLKANITRVQYEDVISKVKIPSSQFDSFSVVAIIPDSKTSFKNIFSEQPFSASNERHTAEAKEAFTREFESNAHFLSSAEHGRDILFSKIRASKSKLVYLVGHNEDGFIRLPNKDQVSILSLVKLAYEESKIPIVISCNCRNYVSEVAAGNLSSETGYFEAVNFIKSNWQRMSKSATTKGEISVSEFIEINNETLKGSTLFEKIMSKINLGSEKLAINIFVHKKVINGEGPPRSANADSNDSKQFGFGFVIVIGVCDPETDEMCFE